jgi:hypothetical protein
VRRVWYVIGGAYIFKNIVSRSSKDPIDLVGNNVYHSYA